MQEPPGQEGVADVTAALLAVRNDDLRSRCVRKRELDNIAATTPAGTDFGVDVLSSHFDRGVQLLADEELHPAFDAGRFRHRSRSNGRANSPAK